MSISIHSTPKEAVDKYNNRMGAEEFFAKAMGLPPTPDQQKGVDWLSTPARYMLMRSANGVGKTAFLSAAALWWMYKHPHCVVLALSKNMTHVKRNFWASLRRQVRNLGGVFDASQIHNDKFAPDDYRQVVLLSPEPTAIESAQGYHAPAVLILCDEANGISMEVFNALMSCMSGVNSKLICAFNPIHPEGYTYEMEGKAGFYVIEMSAFNHPNVVEGREIYPGAMTREKVNADLQTYSKECSKNFPGAIYVPWLKTYYQPTPQILTRILGRWHLLSHDGALDPSVLQEAIYDDPPGSHDIAYCGVDVSKGMRDRTIISYLSKGDKLWFEEVHHNTLTELADKVLTRTAGYPTAVDDGGIGWNLTDRLMNQLGHKNVHRVNFGGAPHGFVAAEIPPKDVRTEMFLLLSDALRSEVPKERLLIPRHPIFFREVTSIRYASTDFRGKYCKIEAKEHIRKRIKASTDFFDSAGLVLYARELEKVKYKKLFY
jgi:hypothetical protein